MAIVQKLLDRCQQMVERDIGVDTRQSIGKIPTTSEPAGNVGLTFLQHVLHPRTDSVNVI
jgi:hypothetical protein